MIEDVIDLILTVVVIIFIFVGLPRVVALINDYLDKKENQSLKGRELMIMHDYAKTEMDIAWPEPDDAQAHIEEDILAVIDLFENQGHSGMSASYTINILERLLRFKPLSPLTGEDDEWDEPCTNVFDKTVYQQNKRCSSVFRTNNDNSTAYDMDAKVFSEDGGKTFWSSYESRVPITFPYTPPTRPERIILNQNELKDSEKEEKENESH